MSDLQHTTTPAAPAPVETTVEPTTTALPTQETPAATETEAAPATAATTEAAKPEETTAAPAEGKVEETVATDAPATETKEAKAVEPITEGLLGYKAPGLLKQFTFSKKDFWLSDSPVTPQNLDLYLRGEKSEISHPVVAWASESGKGLLFFNKKGDTDRTHPAGVLALYEATDLKKLSPHEFSFELHGHKHSFKASGDAERDGWYLSIEKAIELGKASKESIRASEGYKAEIEKLNTPNVIGGAGVAAKNRSLSQPKKSTDLDKSDTARTGSSSSDEAATKKAKSRSTSRGMLNKLKGKKDEVEAKREEKKEEKEVAKEESKIEKEEAKADKEAEKTGEAAPIAATGAALDAPSTAERAVGAPVEEKKTEPIEALPPTVPETKAEEKPKTSKRGSIFGKIPSSWGSMKSPTKEKDQKEAELKPEVPPKDAGVSENPPVLPETTTTEPIDGTAPTTEAAKPEITEPAAETPKAADVVTPNREKKNFLSGLGFKNKRDRSASPSALKDAPKTEASTTPPAKEETAVAEPTKTEEPVSEAPAATATTPVEPAEKPEEKAVEPKTTDATPSANKRSSVLGNLGRRASKAFGGIKTPKKENTAPATTTASEPKVESPVADKESETPVAAPVTEESKEIKPETVGTTQPAPVAASA